MDVLPPLVVGALTNGMYIIISINVECGFLEPFKSSIDMKVVNELTCRLRSVTVGFDRLRSVTVGFDRF